MTTKKEILVRLDITGAESKHCGNCRMLYKSICPWPGAEIVWSHNEQGIDDIERAADCIAAEKDIALAVEAARVEVPEDVFYTLKCAVEECLEHVDYKDSSGPGYSRQLYTAKDWLESLRPAKASESVEKRCGTCAHFEKETCPAMTCGPSYSGWKART